MMKRAAMKAMRSVRMSVVVMVAVFGMVQEGQGDESLSLEWVKSLGPIKDRLSIDAMVVDDLGNIYSTGRFAYTVDFDTGAGTHILTSNGGYDVFVMKQDSMGELLWVVSFGGVETEGVNNIALDNSGNIWLTGGYTYSRVQSRIDFDPGPGTHFLSARSKGGNNYFLKLDPEGKFLWAGSIHGQRTRHEGRDVYGSLSVTDVAVDGAGNFYATGSFSFLMDVDPRPGYGEWYLLRESCQPGLDSYLPNNWCKSYGGRDVFVLKLNSSGEFLWAKSIGGLKDARANSISVDHVGNAYVTGDFSSPISLGNSRTVLLEADNANRSFIIRFNSDGRLRWSKALGPRNNIYGHAGMHDTALDDDGNVYVAGNFSGSVDFNHGNGGRDVLTSPDAGSGFLMKLDQYGQFAWVHSVESERSLSVAINGNDLYLGSLKHSEAGRLYSLTKYDPTTGSVLLSGSIGGGGGFFELNWFRRLPVDGAGNVYARGRFSGAVDFDPSSDEYYLSSERVKS